MLDSCHFLNEVSSDKSEQDLRNDRLLRSAVERELQIIGEALFVLDKVRPDLVVKIPENRRIIRFRHVLVHGYDQLDPSIVWNVVEEKLPALTLVLEELINESPED